MASSVAAAATGQTVPSQPFATAPPPPPVRPAIKHDLKGKCGPAVEDSSRLFQLMGYSGTVQVGCDAADVDWSRRIAFFNRDNPAPDVAFEGRRDPKNRYGLIVDRLLEGGLAQPATGRCAMYAGPEPASPRNIVCYAVTGAAGERQIVTVSFTAADVIPAIGTTTRRSGNCGPSEAMAMVMRIETERATSAEQPDLPLRTLKCDTATVTAGSRVIFLSGGDPRFSVAFSGTAGGEATRIWVSSIAFGTAAPIPAIAGTCVDLRDFDGSTVLSCGAAYRDADGKIQRIVTEFREAVAK